MEYCYNETNFISSYVYVLCYLLPELPHSSIPADLALPLNLYPVRHFRLNVYTLLSCITSISDWLRAGRTGDRIPVVARISAPVQTGPGAHPASCTVGILGLSRE
jgi:hypothetical protein